LTGANLLLSDLHARLVAGKELSSDDILRLNQLDDTASNIDSVMQEYDHNLKKDADKITKKTDVLNNTVNVAMIVVVIAIILVVYLYIMRPINILTIFFSQLYLAANQ